MSAKSDENDLPQAEPVRPLTWVLDCRGVSEIPTQGQKIATSEECAQVAAALELAAVHKLACDYEMRREPGGDVLLDAHLVADLAQSCVVTLEPVAGHIQTAFQLRFARRVSSAGTSQAQDNALDLDMEQADPPEPLVDNRIALGGYVFEHFAIELNPYPRKPGAQWEEAPKGPDPAHPFAALKALKQNNQDD